MAATDTTVEEFRELEDPEAAARAAGLRYVSDEDPGLTRRRRGTGWSYYPPDDTRITDLEERDRLNALAVPPAWTDVWICPRPNGHIQATGRDDRGRKQYRYHPDWRAVRDLAKFARMVPFGQALPRIRRRTAAHLRKEGLPREKVLAAVIRLLERSLIRVGNSEYTNANGSYGLTTLRDRHVDFRGSRVRFEFRGKGGKQLFVELEDPRLARIVRQCRDVPGYDLFQYYDENGERRTVGSGDVNQYLREIAGEEFSAKDFRTWAGTLHAALALQECGPCSDEPEAKRRVGESIEKVAERLGNTPAVCRACYVHPAVIECYLDGTLADRMGSGAGGPARPAKVRGLSAEESAVLALLGA